MNNLLPGLRKFSSEVFPNYQPLFETLSQGQKPHTLMITCSDSRIDPSLVTQTQPGEVFVIRNAGNIVPPFGASRGGEEATIEFAVDGLKVSNVVVCGHTQCGAMSALMGKVDLSGLPSVRTWLEHAQSTARRAKARKSEPSPLEVVEENVLAQADNLKTHPSVAAALRAGRIRIFGWVYHFETGAMTLYDTQSKRYQLSSEVKDQAANDTSRFAL